MADPLAERGGCPAQERVRLFRVAEASPAASKYAIMSAIIASILLSLAAACARAASVGSTVTVAISGCRADRYASSALHHRQRLRSMDDKAPTRSLFGLVRPGDHLGEVRRSEPVQRRQGIADDAGRSRRR